MVRAGCEALFESNYRLDSTVQLEDVVANKREAFWYDCRKRAAACGFAHAKKPAFFGGSAEWRATPSPVHLQRCDKSLLWNLDLAELPHLLLARLLLF
jgi:hypothetical protein